MTNPIKTRADGSIDTAHYMSRGRMARSQAAHEMARTVFQKQAARMSTGRFWVTPFAIVSIAALTVPYIV
ncbi:MAG: hypothetical protein Rhims3KO_32340 [Hyphomicrobiales bacterium]